MTQSLQYFRKMGSMEQLFTIFNDLKINAWGPAVGVHKISNLSSISLDKLQEFWNMIHCKYEAYQTQIMTVEDVNEYGDIYLGVLPFTIIKYDGDIHELTRREINHRFLLLNDFDITAQDITNHNYSVNSVCPLYRVFICSDYFVLNINHAIGDGMSLATVMRDLLRLLNGDASFTYTIVPYTTIEQCIDPQYAASATQRKISNWIPTHWSISFGKFYANHSFLRKWNPLKFHRDDLLSLQYMFNTEFLQFPLQHPYNRHDFTMDYVLCPLSKSVSLNIKRACKSHKVHISSVLAYIVNAAMIEAHNDILTNDSYKTMIGNVFTTVPMYRKEKRTPQVGIHAGGYLTVIQYYKETEIGSDKWWNLIHKISDQVLNDKKIHNIYKSKFPYMNIKKYMHYAMDDKYNVIGDRAMAAPSISNPGVFDVNKDFYKYKMLGFFGVANPGVGWGAPYIVGGATIKGIDQMVLNFGYGTQYLSNKTAKRVTHKMKQMFNKIASPQAKL
eukprot:340747_1